MRFVMLTSSSAVRGLRIVASTAPLVLGLVIGLVIGGGRKELSVVGLISFIPGQERVSARTTLRSTPQKPLTQRYGLFAIDVE